MIVVCPNCKTRYELSEREVDCPNFLARCAKCGQTFPAFIPVRIEELNFMDIISAKKGKPHANILAISNQKGGVAKTSTCLNLGLSLSKLGKKVLLVDFDVQANLTISLGYKETASFYEVACGNNPLHRYIEETKYQNLFLFPSNKNMVLLNKKYFGARNFEFILKDRILQIKDHFDFIVIDTPPSIEFFTLNALTAASMVIIPSQCDYLSTHGVDQILKLITLIKAKTNPFIRSRILITMFEKASEAAEMIRSKLSKLYPEMLFNTIIDIDPRIREAQIMGMPVLHYNPESRAGLQYHSVAEEIVGLTKHSK